MAAKGYWTALLGTLAAAGGPSLPASGNLAAHFAADAITPQSDNTALSSWTDSVSGLSATQGTGGSQPVYRANRLGGKPSVQFTGSKFLSGLFPALKTTIDSKLYTVMIVFNNVAAAANGCLFGNSAGSNSFLFQATGSVVGRFDGGNTGTSVPWSSTAFMTFGTSSQPTKKWPTQSGTLLERLYMRGTCVSTNVAGGPATSAADGSFGIGAISSAGTLSCKADIYEIIVWNRVLTEMEWLQAETWACSKYSQPLPWAGLSSLDVYTGDSLTVGVNGASIALHYPARAAAARSRTFGQYTVQAVGGIAWADITSMVADWKDMAAYMGVPMNICAFEWYNEKNQGHTPAQAWTNCKTFCDTVRALPSGSPKLGLMSSTGYLNDGTDPYASVRGAYNTLFDSEAAAHSDAQMPLHSDATAGPAIGASGAYAANSATYWSGDGIHLNDTGYGVLATAAVTCMNAMRA